METELETEQMFALAKLRLAAQTADREQLELLIVEMYQNMLIQEKLFKAMLAESWGLKSL